MSNIRVDLGYEIRDGEEVKFRTPADCSAVTGLIIYYPSQSGILTSTEFVFADAHGNNVGDIDHLFAENVVVKVILDMVSRMAFVQNADTNSYLEENFAKKSELQGIYLGSGEMPENCNVQIDPNGDALTIDDIVDEIVEIISSVGDEHEGKFLRVVNGRATWTTVPSAEEGSF